MHRIDTSTAQKDKWGAGKNGWTNGDPATGVRATSFNASFCDAIQEEICNAIEKSGLTLDPEDNTQLFKVLSKITTGMGDYLAIDQNLAEIAAEGAGAQSAARANLGLKTAATRDVQESKDDITPGRVLINGSAVAVRSSIAKAGEAIADAGALPANSVSFCYANAANSPGYEATILDVGSFGEDYRVQFAASYADGGKRLKFRSLNSDISKWGQWTTVITNYGGTVEQLTVSGQLNSGGNIVAGQGLYESGGLVRVYSSNNPPPKQDLSPYATQAWTVANFLQGGIRLASLGSADNGNNDNNYAYAPNGAVVTAVMQKTNYTAVQYRYVQYNIGGNWYTAWVA